ncbi:MAG: M81 family metallopeptidase [Planctomycetota bacterium]|nr:M81 family metallopeptidase [Planctomycetota bacterium]
MRIAIAEVGQETDSFSPLTTDLRDFEGFGLFFGDEILQRMRGVGPLGGMLEVASQQPTPPTLLPILRAWAGAGGALTAATLEFFRDRLVSDLKRMLPLDAVFLALHGAAAAESEDDVEGELLSVVRGVVGPDLPVIVTLDHHANITRRMVQHATNLIGHETQPHDPVETGRKTARVMFDLLAGRCRPTMAWRKIPLITPQDQFLTSQGPMKEWFDLAREMERRPGVIDVSPYPMQPWLDVQEGGWAVVVHTDGDPKLAEELAKESAAKAWSLREKFWESARTPVADAVRQAVAAESGLIILSDTGDSVYGGSPGDSTCILRELLRQNVPCRTLVPMVDVAAVAAAHAAGVGARIQVSLGGSVDHVFSQPVPVDARVAGISNGVTLELPDRGPCDLGRAALLEIGAIRLVALDSRTFAINHPSLYMHLGLDINDAKIVVLKTASNFQFFSRWRKGLIRVDSPGTTQSDLTAFDWKRVPRPIYPLDLVTEYNP